MKVELRFFIDDANGEYGLAHKNAINKDFNAFWDRIGIFHDVFEHNHEEKHKYFMNDYAFNIGGEMTAMGCLWYYSNTLGVYNRMNFHDWSWQGGKNLAIFNTTKSYVEDNICYGNGSFGSELLSSIPRQHPIDDSEFEDMLNHYYWNAINKLDPQSSMDEDVERGIEYKKSCSLRKLRDLHRYGYRMAEKLIPDNGENRTTLINFIDYWEIFTNTNNADNMYEDFSGIDFYISKHRTIVNWNAILLSRKGRNIKINQDKQFKLDIYE